MCGPAGDGGRTTQLNRVRREGTQYVPWWRRSISAIAKGRTGAIISAPRTAVVGRLVSALKSTGNVPVFRA